MNRGEITVLRGRNGSGKTTLGKLLAGIVKPDSGRVLVAGRDTKKTSLGELGALLGYVWQDVTLQFFAETVLDDMTFSDVLMGRDREASLEKARAWLARFGLSAQENAPISRLSGGERARLALAETFMREPAFLILDEPTANLDDKSVSALTALLRELRDTENVGMLIVSHDAELIRAVGDRALTMENGEITDDGCI